MRYFIYLLLFTVPMISLASHNSRVDRSGLDDDAVDSFAIPVLFGVDMADVTPDFGDSRGGGSRTHEGQDFRAPQGAPIISPTEAIVLRTGTGDSAGKYVYTANPGGETFRYMHLDQIANISAGDKLDVGDYIGTVGDTGNAPDGIYHLHFETRDADNEPTDPYERLSNTFTLEQQIEFLDDVFRKRRDDADYAEFLVETFPQMFKQALAENIDLPAAIGRALEDTDIKDHVSDTADLTQLIESIPSLLPVELQTGDSGVLVTLLQIYLIYGSDGADRDRLAAAGPTGYYGSLTAAAVEALQDTEQITENGLYNTKTQQTFAGRSLRSINLGN